jgi:hypothetical protein
MVWKNLHIFFSFSNISSYKNKFHLTCTSFSRDLRLTEWMSENASYLCDVIMAFCRRLWFWEIISHTQAIKIKTIHLHWSVCDAIVLLNSESFFLYLFYSRKFISSTIDISTVCSNNKTALNSCAKNIIITNNTKSLDVTEEIKLHHHMRTIHLRNETKLCIFIFPQVCLHLKMRQKETFI